MRRVFSHPDVDALGKGSPADATSEVKKQEAAFLVFLDEQLKKIDEFYQMKEQEAAERLKVLRQQLHIMRDQRIQELYDVRRANKRRNVDAQIGHNGFRKLNSSRLKDTLTGKVHFGKNSQALAQMATPKNADPRSRIHLQPTRLYAAAGTAE
jgi:SPX domain.